MVDEKKSEFLIGQLLVAMPDIGDPRFAKSVILLCFHSEEGAMGVVLNKPAGQVKLSDILQKSEKESVEEFDSITIHFGGPVEQYRAIFVHSSDCGEYSSTKFVSDELGITTTPDILEDFSRGKGPKSSKLLLGYAGWSPGQLENEIQQNSWLVCEGNPDIVFGTGSVELWNAAVKSLGIAPSMLSSVGGRA
ncbi:MAG: YqgE/AlgH family protein [Albidovulum sp.]|nr:YqgE/AlgH family protein [Albidovulum sp.]